MKNVKRRLNCCECMAGHGPWVLAWYLELFRTEPHLCHFSACPPWGLVVPCIYSNTSAHTRWPLFPPFVSISFEQGVRRLACGSHVCRRLSPLSNLWVINMKNIRAVVLVVFAHVKREAVVRDVHEKCLRVGLQLITVLH